MEYTAPPSAWQHGTISDSAIWSFKEAKFWCQASMLCLKQLAACRISFFFLLYFVLRPAETGCWDFMDLWSELVLVAAGYLCWVCFLICGASSVSQLCQDLKSYTAVPFWVWRLNCSPEVLYYLQCSHTLWYANSCQIFSLHNLLLQR